MRKFPNSIKPCKINMCINMQCIKLKAFRNNTYQDWQVEPFVGKIRVPEEITLQVKELPVVDGVEWILENPNADVKFLHH